MKVCVVIPNFFPAVVYGGWVFSSLNTCRELAKLGVTSFVSTTNDNGVEYLPANSKIYIELEDHIYVKYYDQSIRERFSFSMLFNLWKDVKYSDIVHVQGIFSAPTPLALFYASVFRKKILLSPHGCLGSWCMADGSKFKKIYLKLCVKPFSENVRWHATSLQEKNEILSLYPKAKVEIIPNGINMSEFDIINRFTKIEFLQKYAGVKGNPDHIFISMSRLHKKKGLDILIDAFSKVLEIHANSMLMIAGDDFGEKFKLQQQINELKLNKHVFFVGHLKNQERIDFFANADAFVLPSHNENFGLVFAEAMAAGTPVVASKGTPWEELEILKIGKWVQNTPESTAQAMIDLLKDDYKKIGEKSRDFVSSKYSWRSIGKRFENLFEAMINE